MKNIKIENGKVFRTQEVEILPVHYIDELNNKIKNLESSILAFQSSLDELIAERDAALLVMKDLPEIIALNEKK